MSESCENNAFCNKWHPILKAAILDRISVGSNSAGRSHLSVAEIAKAVNASRPTVYKHIDYVSNLLKEFGATHKHRSPDAKIKKSAVHDTGARERNYLSEGQECGPPGRISRHISDSQHASVATPGSNTRTVQEKIRRNWPMRFMRTIMHYDSFSECNSS